MTKEELIGKQVTIIASTNTGLVGKQGIIVDETKNMLIVEIDGKIKKIVKDQCVFDVEGKQIKGSSITRRPEERIKQ